jgi:hypothetical protein
MGLLLDSMKKVDISELHEGCNITSMNLNTNQDTLAIAYNSGRTYVVNNKINVYSFPEMNIMNEIDHEGWTTIRDLKFGVGENKFYTVLCNNCSDFSSCDFVRCYDANNSTECLMKIGETGIGQARDYSYSFDITEHNMAVSADENKIGKGRVKLYTHPFTELSQSILTPHRVSFLFCLKNDHIVLIGEGKGGFTYTDISIWKHSIITKFAGKQR